nr:nucleotide-binding alpha-beta plait domain-containing protein [Tanacetum cinerariifolium]
MPKKTEDNSNNGRRIDKMSYVNVVNGDTKSTEACEPALLLDESCLNQLDYSLGLLGKVKEFSSFDNMRMGKMLYLEKLDEGCLYSKRLCILTTGKSNILETFKIIHKGKRFSVRAKETTGWILNFDEQEKDNSELEDEQSIGFIKEDFDGSDVEKEGDNNVSMVPDSVKEDVNVQAEEKEACEPALLLDESCLNQLDYSLGLLGKVKEFSCFDNMRMLLGNEGFNDIDLSSFDNMRMVLENEGFNDIDLRYMGGATSWFSQIIQASKEFVIDERITWVDIKGIPLKLWSESTYNRIAAKWGKMLYMEKLDEGCLYSKRLCILTTGKSDILETFKIIHKGKRFSVRAKETTGWNPDFDEQEEDNSESEDEQSIGFVKEDFDGSDVEKEWDNNVSMVPDSVKEDVKKNMEEKMDKSNGTVSIPFPPGFTPCDETEVECDKKSMGNNKGSGFGNEKGLNPKAKKDWVKEICVSHKVNFLTLQETKMEDISLTDVKCCWGNYAFEYVYSPAVGNSGGILYVWEKSDFKKNNSTISDYFVMIG